MSDIDVTCDARPDGWLCHVSVSDGGTTSRHEVGLTTRDLEGLAPGEDDPTGLVRASFEFLLEREPKESILRAFDLPVIGRYFPEYPTTIRDRMMRGDV